MNIFALDKDPAISAQYHCDKHVVKMILESAQIMSTSLQLYGVDSKLKPTHVNHPCCVWARESSSNFHWLSGLALSLCSEYTYRYERVHSLQNEILNMYGKSRNVFPSLPRSEFVQAMPDYCKHEDSVTAYKNYYLNEKSHLLYYKKRDMPNWII